MTPEQIEERVKVYRHWLKGGEIECKVVGSPLMTWEVFRESNLFPGNHADVRIAQTKEQKWEEEFEDWWKACMPHNGHIHTVARLAFLAAKASSEGK